MLHKRQNRPEAVSHKTFCISDQSLAPKARTPRTQTTDNGKQNTYFSSLDNMVAQGNVLPVLYGEMRVGSRVVSQEISTADEGDGGQVVVIGR
ncbi:Tail assembly protein I [Shigella sonnei]|nr:Tail assembly protein I [Shigella sonnei]